MAAVTAKNLAPVHVRTGRAILDISGADFADMCGLTGSLIKKFESGRGASEKARQAMIDALECEGVKLYNGGQPGARLMKSKIGIEK